jgi:N-acylneuraminate cytidylyltransferase
MSKKVNVFLPMRAGSDRVLGKNTRAFSGINGGLCRIKIKEILIEL